MRPTEAFMGTENDVLGVHEPGKRVVLKEEQQVTREEFEAQKIFNQYLFGERGLVDTLGPTWLMIHDPRFVAIENSFVKKKPNRFLGGDATQGVNRQQADGSFSSGVEDLNQYGEILGEGRYFHNVLRSMAYHKAIGELWKRRRFAIPKKEYLPGIFIFNQLLPEEQAEVVKLAATYTEFYPRNIVKQREEAIWGLIKQECPNYFSRKGVPNQVAQDLFTMLRLGLVGLIDDYAEVAKLQEWVLLDHENTLVEQQHIDTEAPRIWAEVEVLEKALTIRTSLRATATEIMRMMGLHHRLDKMDVVLTDSERDGLLQIIYASNWPDDQPQLVVSVLGFLASIQASGKSFKEREHEQCAAASAEAKAYIAKLKSGEEQPITRFTEPGDDENLNHLSDEERTAQEILHNPIKQMVFIRYAAIEKKRDAVNDRIAEIDATLDGSDATTPIEDVAKLQSERAQLTQRHEALVKAAELFVPVFTNSEYELTEEAAADLLIAAEAFDSTAMKTVPHPDDAASTETNPTPVEVTQP
jgi:hypothetical protein